MIVVGSVCKIVPVSFPGFPHVLLGEPWNRAKVLQYL